ncbi:MAG TPA: hypothetical protein VK502_04575 [Candidatus Saccharimonadales bacterium]|nr:hypothetical protein [Candidatus Saccharimonadales bacterium]
MSRIKIIMAVKAFLSLLIVVVITARAINSPLSIKDIEYSWIAINGD